ncbi:MAG: hypothetical protein ACJAYN_001062 [Bermanella sp.]|jgi:hypothetical protein|uniref:MAPEG family protein n=1 Tax=Glaciecola sp. 33A TaxID=2057807 RepID=UPI000C34FB00|nr:MAPEG family protein [Glaciecola sp. 33A]PKI02903.1 hypothetical protein CXF81_04505 [Glaciecola sp. 33A]
MNASIIVLLGYISWTLVLLLALAFYRTYLSQSGKFKGLKFQADGSDVPEFGNRLTRAQANCVECFSFIGGVLLLAIATDSTAITNGLAYILLAARLGQSIVHLVSTTNIAIQARFVFFLIQFGIVIYWVLTLFTKFL